MKTSLTLTDTKQTTLSDRRSLISDHLIDPARPSNPLCHGGVHLEDLSSGDKLLDGPVGPDDVMHDQQVSQHIGISAHVGVRVVRRPSVISGMCARPMRTTLSAFFLLTTHFLTIIGNNEFIV